MPTPILHRPSPLRLEAQPVVATRLMQALAEGSLSAKEVARIVESDGALSMRVIRLANAPYYGAAGQVASAARAVLLLGLSTVKGVVATSACSLLRDDSVPPPPGYLAFSLAAGAATSAVARTVGLPPQDSYSLGILHDIGRLVAQQDDLDHAGAGAGLLAASRFPNRFVQAVLLHHEDPGTVADPLARALIAGLALAATITPPPADPPPPDHERALAAVGLGIRDAARLAAAAEQEIESRTSLLGVSR